MYCNLTALIVATSMLAGCAPQRLYTVVPGPYRSQPSPMPPYGYAANYPVGNGTQPGANYYGATPRPNPPSMPVPTNQEQRRIVQEITDAQRLAANGDFNANLKLGSFYSQRDNPVRSLKDADIYLQNAVRYAPGTYQQKYALDMLNKVRSTDMRAWNASDPNKSVASNNSGPGLMEFLAGAAAIGIGLGIAAREAGYTPSATSSSQSSAGFDATAIQRKTNCDFYTGEKGSLAEVQRGFNC